MIQDVRMVKCVNVSEAYRSENTTTAPIQSQDDQEYIAAELRTHRLLMEMKYKKEDEQLKAA
jgi:hypothetical protein